MSWLDAEKFCQSRDGHLWSINSYEEWHQLYDRRRYAHNSYSLALDRFDPIYFDHSFIGLHVDIGNDNDKVTSSFYNKVTLLRFAIDHTKGK